MSSTPLTDSRDTTANIQCLSQTCGDIILFVWSHTQFDPCPVQVQTSKDGDKNKTY